MDDSSEGLRSPDTDNEFTRVNRHESVQQVIARVLEERDRGNAMSDSDVLEQYADMAEELKPQLRIANQIRQAKLAAERAGGLRERQVSLTDSEFEEMLGEVADVSP